MLIERNNRLLDNVSRVTERRERAAAWRDQFAERSGDETDPRLEALFRLSVFEMDRFHDELDHLALAREMREQGQSWFEVARQLETSLEQARRRYGDPQRRPRQNWSHQELMRPEIKSAVEEARAAGATDDEIGDALGLGGTAIAYHYGPRGKTQSGLSVERDGTTGRTQRRLDAAWIAQLVDTSPLSERGRAQRRLFFVIESLARGTDYEHLSPRQKSAVLADYATAWVASAQSRDSGSPDVRTERVVAINVRISKALVNIDWTQSPPAILSYLSRHVQGAILDYGRASGPLSRSAYKLRQEFRAEVARQEKRRRGRD